MATETYFNKLGTRKNLPAVYYAVRTVRLQLQCDKKALTGGSSDVVATALTRSDNDLQAARWRFHDNKFCGHIWLTISNPYPFATTRKRPT